MYKYIYKKYTLPGNFTHMHTHTWILYTATQEQRV